MKELRHGGFSLSLFHLLCEAPKPNTCRAKIFGVAHCEREQDKGRENELVSTITSVPSVWAVLFICERHPFINVFIS